MPDLGVKNWQNEVVGQVELSETVFNAPLNRALIYGAVRWFRAGQRAGTASTKTRDEVSGAGKKLWRQKGTGRARIGSLRSPVWRHGGTVHGPQPRSYAYGMPKKMRRGAVCSVLSERLREGNITVLEAYALASHKTKGLAKALEGLGVLDKGRALIVEVNGDRNLRLAARNLPRVTQVDMGRVNVYDLLKHQQLLFSKSAILELDKHLRRTE